MSASKHTHIQHIYAYMPNTTNTHTRRKLRKFWNSKHDTNGEALWSLYIYVHLALVCTYVVISASIVEVYMYVYLYVY